MRTFLKFFISSIVSICLLFLLLSFLLTYNAERLLRLVDNRFLEDLRISPQNITLHYSGIYPGFEIETLEIRNNNNVKIFNLNNVSLNINLFKSLINFNAIFQKVNFEIFGLVNTLRGFHIKENLVYIENLYVKYNDFDFIFSESVIENQKNLYSLKSKSGKIARLPSGNINLEFNQEAKVLFFRSEHNLKSKDLKEFMASRSFKSLESTSISDLDFIHSGHYEIENNIIKQKFKLQKVIHSEIKILNKSLVIKDGDLVLENFNNLSGIINSNYSSQQLAFKVDGKNLITTPKLSLSTAIELDIESILDRTAIYNASGKTKLDIDFVNENGESKVLFKSNLKGISIDSPFSYLQKRKNAVLDTEGNVSNFFAPKVQLFNKKYAISLHDIKNLYGDIFIGKKNPNLESDDLTKSLNIFIDIDNFDLDEYLLMSNNLNQSSKLIETLNIFFDIKKLRMYDKNYYKSSGSLKFDNDSLEISFIKGDLLGDINTDLKRNLNINLSGLNLDSNKFPIAQAKKQSSNDFTINLSLKDSMIDSYKIINFSSLIYSNGSDFEIRNLEIDSNILKVLSNSQDTYFIYREGNNSNEIKGHFQIANMNRIPFLNMDEKFSVGYSDLLIDLKFNEYKDFFNLQGNMDILLKDFSLSSFLPNSNILNIVGIFNLRNILGKVANLDLSLQEFAQTEINRLETNIIIDEDSLFIKDQMVLDTNSAKMLWRGRINKNDSKYLEELDLYLKMRLRVGENIPWYAGIFGGLPVAASAYIFREVFESDIDDATTFEFDVVGSINNPQINRIN
tara:strand:- start:437 stop:2815 length:2379 start_codon:yes stop_codon:yes gene_type:complete